MRFGPASWRWIVAPKVPRRIDTLPNSAIRHRRSASQRGHYGRRLPVKDGFPVTFQSGQCARLAGSHQAGIADHVAASIAASFRNTFLNHG